MMLPHGYQIEGELCHERKQKQTELMTTHQRHKDERFGQIKMMMMIIYRHWNMHHFRRRPARNT